MLISGINHSYFFQGTGVLGEVAAVDNTMGCVGIAPAASVRCVSQWLTSGGYSTSQPIMDAVAAMTFGDVLLLEAQTSLARTKTSEKRRCFRVSDTRQDGAGCDRPAV